MKKNHPSSGFTLIELIFVSLLMVLLTSFAIPKVASIFGINLRSGALKLAGYLQTAYEQSVMRHQTIRVHFNLEKGTYWAEEMGDPPVEPLWDQDTKLDEAIEKFEKRVTESKELTQEEEAKKEETKYKKIDQGTLRERELPSGVKLKGIFLAVQGQFSQNPSPWIYFYPSGFGAKTVIYLWDGSDETYSVILPPLGGRATIEKGEASPEDV